ncbi:MAG: HRDC domain-containing protein [Anaerolineae bacterium]|nr:HRDC domain-containing protein [Anaerolineae bacterium]
MEKVFHAAENDILMLKRDYGFHFAHLFDTMIASRILGWPHVSLAALLEEHFGVHLDKRMQRANWGKRPLTTEQLAYARLDTRFLLPLRDLIHQELLAKGRWEEALEAFAALPHIQFVEKPFDPDGFWRINGAKRLSGPQLAVLRELYLWREEWARRLDRPPFKVLTDRALVLLSERQPRTITALRRLPGVSRLVSQRHGEQLLAAIREGQSAPTPEPPERRRSDQLRPDEATLARYDALRAWRSRRAAARGVDPDIVLTNDVLMRIARENPSTLDDLAQIDRLGSWKLHTYGPELLDLLSRLATE